MMAGLGDGSLISQQRIQPLEIPRQTAVITHAGGRETLTIWNTVQADAGSLAWVLPLPVVPEVIQQTHPAAVRLLQMVASPTVSWSRFDRLSMICAGFILTTGIAFLVVRRPRKSWGQGCALVAAILLVCIFTAGAMFRYSRYIPSRTMEVSAAVGVRLLATQEVGDFETAIVSGDSAERLNGWLSTNGFRPFTGRQAAAVDHYIAQKWVFLCARLKAGAAGLTAVHPMTVRFASPRLVYPMRLTEGSGPGTVPVDLYVVGENHVRDPTSRLKQIVTTSTQRMMTKSHGSLGTALLCLVEARGNPTDGTPQELDGWTASVFEGGVPPVIPEGKDVLLDSLLRLEHNITYLSGEFGPGSDWSDISLEESPAHGQSRRHHTAWSWFRAMLGGPWALGGVLAVLMLAFFARLNTEPGERPGKRWRVAALAASGALCVTGLALEARHTTFVSASRLEPPLPGSPDSFEGLLKTWIGSLK